MGELNCAGCRSGKTERAGRGRKWIRCYHSGALRGPGRVVTCPLPESVNLRKAGVEAPVWCPRRLVLAGVTLPRTPVGRPQA